MMNIDVKRWSELEYPITLALETEQDGSKCWVAEIPMLKGCMGVGDTKEEALALLEDAKKAWLEAAVSMGETIPLASGRHPVASGKFTVRLPKTLHRDLVIDAKQEGVSLNQYVLFVLVNRDKVEGSAPTINRIHHVIKQIQQDNPEHCQSGEQALPTKTLTP